MNVCVQGLWHLGAVTAACLAEAGHHVIGLDHDPSTIEGLRAGKAPISEPGLDAMIARNKIEFTTDIAAAARADVLWVTYDTPVDADDVADVEFVVAKVQAVLPHLRDGAVVIVSSQLPVGSVARLETPRLMFACSPENLRLGKALEVFQQPDRVVVGVRSAAAKALITELLAPITSKIEWMSVESAEMTKHAINAFLALSVTFANELATTCEQVGADAKEVERGLKTESRIGPRAYLGPGGAFAGGTLARDIAFLSELAAQHHLTQPLIAAVRPSNEAHKKWALRRLGDVASKTIAIWGLTYKPGTDTLRRSSSVELALALVAAGATVQAWDPAVRGADLPITFATDAYAATRGASGLVIATEWPELRQLDLAAAFASMQRRFVVDANRFLAKQVAGLDVEYYAVGVPNHG
ncbi:MAG: nucleotide sugar dehydrogenase [Kofleriaceae bacterium]